MLTGKRVSFHLGESHASTPLHLGNNISGKFYNHENGVRGCKAFQMTQLRIVLEKFKFPPVMRAAVPSVNNTRTNSGPAAFHSHFKRQFYSQHPALFMFLGALQK